MGILEDIIVGASSDGVTTTNLLRKVQTVAHRIGASELRTWVKSELDGYGLNAHLPTYREAQPAIVQATWSGPFNSSANSTLSEVGTPDDMRMLFEVSFRQAVPELEALASLKKELMQPWDGYAIGRYNELITQGRVPRFEMMGLYSARRVITPAMVKAVSESVRTQALELALDLQAANPLTGESDGPTRDDPAIDRALTVNINHIYGDGANVAQGTGITQTSTVTKGDLGGLVVALEKLIADRDAIRDAVAIITSDADEPQKRTKLQKVGDAIAAGTINLTSGVTSNVAAAGLMELAGQYLGW